MAAKNGVVRRREISTSESPSGGPISPAKHSMASTGRAPLPASAEPNQSRNSSSARRTTGFGMSSRRRHDAKRASAALGESSMRSAPLDSQTRLLLDPSVAQL